MEIFDDLEQGTDAWFRARSGIPTASEFSTVLAKGKKGEESLTRAKYMRKLAAERITGEPGETFSTPAMERGKVMEAEARNLYAFLTNADPHCVGFIRNGDKGCSPDALIGIGGMLEIKTQRADLLIETLLRDDFPPEHKAQCQGALWVAERDYIDLMVFWPGMTPFLRRAFRDEAYIDNLRKELARFNEELEALVERVRKIEPPRLREPEMPREMQRMGAG